MSTISEKEFSRIFNLYYKEICLFLNYYTHDQFIIEEVVQDVFLKLWEEREKHHILHIKTYLLTSVRNQVLNTLRNHKNREQFLSRWAEEELYREEHRDCIDRDHFIRTLHSAVELLPERCREAFTLRYQKQLSYQKIAEMQDVSIKTVENQLTKALKLIRKYILKHSTHSTVYILLFLKFTEK